MGCDIHLHVEIKDGVKWKHLCSPDPGRSSSMFAMMANVYNDGDIEPISEPRGLPDDVTDETKMEYDDWNYFAPSWLSDKEIAILRDRYAEYMKREWQVYNSDITRDAFNIEYPNPNGKLRLVFWFDN